MHGASLNTRSLLNKGIYTVPEAARLAKFATKSHVSARALRRWLWGYRKYPEPGVAELAPPLWEPELPRLHDRPVLSFRDLIEVMFVAAFRERGISLQTIRRLIGRAIEEIETSHPLSSPAFKTDGNFIRAEVVTSDERRICFDLATGQYLLEIVFDRLRQVIEYSDILTAARWWPIGKDRKVVVDPAIRFGEPIDVERGVPTVILANAYKAEQSYGAVSHWYGVTEGAVRDAVEYERRVAAA